MNFAISVSSGSLHSRLAFILFPPVLINIVKAGRFNILYNSFSQLVIYFPFIFLEKLKLVNLFIDSVAFINSFETRLIN